MCQPDQRPTTQIGDQERHRPRTQGLPELSRDRLHGIDRGRVLGRTQHSRHHRYTAQLHPRSIRFGQVTGPDLTRLTAAPRTDSTPGVHGMINNAGSVATTATDYAT